MRWANYLVVVLALVLQTTIHATDDQGVEMPFRQAIENVQPEITKVFSADRPASLVQSTDPEASSYRFFGIAMMVAGGVMAIPALTSWSDYTATNATVTGWDNVFFRRAVGWSVASGAAFGIGIWSFSKGNSMQRGLPSLLRFEGSNMSLGTPAVSVRSRLRRTPSGVPIQARELYVPIVAVGR